MNKDIALRWAEALESGDYLQGEGALYRSDVGAARYCCLGVLCDLADRAGVASGRECGPWHFPTDGATLPDRIMNWAGMATDYGRFVVDGDGRRVTSLMALNDTGLSFTEIAKLIREHADEL